MNSLTYLSSCQRPIQLHLRFGAHNQMPNTDHKPEPDLLQLLPGCCKLPLQLGFGGLMLLQHKMLLAGNLLELCLLAIQLAPQLLLTGTRVPEWGESISLCLTAGA